MAEGQLRQSKLQFGVSAGRMYVRMTAGELDYCCLPLALIVKLLDGLRSGSFEMPMQKAFSIGTILQNSRPTTSG